MFDFTEKYVKSLNSHPNNPKNRDCFADVVQICAPKREYCHFCGDLVTKSFKENVAKSRIMQIWLRQRNNSIMKGVWTSEHLSREHGFSKRRSSIGAIRIENDKCFCDIMGVDLSLEVNALYSGLL